MKKLPLTSILVMSCMVGQANFAADQSRTAKQPPKQTFEQI